MKTAIKYFVQGLFVVTPIAVTLYVVLYVITAIDGLLPVGVPGLGFVLTIGLIVFVGFLASNVLGQSVIGAAESLLKRLPLVKLVYTSIKDLLEAFVGNKRSFDRPVAVQLPGGAGKALGFATCDALSPAPLRDHVAVYFPQSYNFAGNVLLIPRDRVEPLDVVSSDLMTFIVSGGVSAASLVKPPVVTPLPLSQRY